MNQATVASVGPATGHRSEGGPSLQSARNREVGVATEILLSKAEQVSDEGACAAGLRLK
jgi:hypothetical protein